MMKRMISLALAFCLCLALMPAVTMPAEAAVVYNRDAAIAYAAAHATDTPEIAGADCANFVSKCVTAGGISVSQTVCHNLMLALEPYAATVTNLEIVLSGGYGRVPVGGDNASILSKGDVMFVCCEKCKSTGNNYERHAVIYSGEADSNGYAKCYAHTSMANNTTFKVGYNGSYACSNGHAVSYLAAEVVHFGEVAGVPSKPTVSTSGATVTVSWNDVANETSYDVYLIQSPWGWPDVEYSKSVSANTTSCTFTGVAEGEYRAFIIARPNGDTSEDQSPWSDIFTVVELPDPPSKPTVSTSGTTVTVSWNDVDNETSYDVYMLQSPWGWSDIKYTKSVSADTTSCTFTGVTEGEYRAFIIARPSGDTEEQSPWSDNFTVTALQYTVTYNANGGSGAPSSQTKTHGTALTLSSTKPARTGYTFMGWSTSSSATSAAYQPGGSFTKNANTTLYAVWEKGCEGGSHSYSYKATKSPTTSATGTLTGTCSDCSATTTVTLPKLSTSDYTYKVTKAATCTADGTGRYTWKTTTYGSFCFDVSLAATGHTYTEKVTAPTCTAQGYTTYTCSCGYSYKSDYVDAKGHSYGEWVEIKAPTEDTDGLKQRTCPCGAEQEQTIPSLDHTHAYTKKVTAPTCTVSGYTTYTCSCGDSYKSNYVDAAGHSYAGKVTAPTCTVSGYTTYTCHCGQTYKSDYVDATGHSYSEWVEVKAPTEDTDGLKRRACPCGAEQEQTIPRLDHTHSYTKKVTAPTCTVSGYTTYTCNCGDTYVADEKNALGHAWGAWEVIEEAQVGKEGVERRECGRCAAFEQKWLPAKTEDPKPQINPFTDVKAGAFYYDSVLWAVEEGITSGVSATTFAPNNPCTRAQVVTFLWRANGSPEPKSSANPFKDVKQSDYFYKAVLWAVEEGITNGVSADRFAPGSPCTRGQVVSFLWRDADSPSPVSTANSFQDVSSASYYYTAVLWAVEENITNGVSTNRFAPNSTCTRGQIVTFLYRAMTK